MQQPRLRVPSTDINNQWKLALLPWYVSGIYVPKFAVILKNNRKFTVKHKVYSRIIAIGSYVIFVKGRQILLQAE